MNSVSIGDMAMNFQNRRHNVQLKTDLLRLSQELSSGHRQDLSSLVTGDLLPIASLEHALKVATAFSTATSEAALLAETMQASLELVQNNSAELGAALLVASNSESPIMIQTATVDAKLKFEAVVSSFNIRIADRYAFSGMATDQAALADADTILASLQIATAAETTAAGVESVVSAWFDDPGGAYETVGYTGSNVPLAAVRLSPTDAVSLSISAADSEVREVLKGFAMAALVGQGSMNGSATEQATLIRTAGEQLLTSQFDLTALRAKVGSAEARIHDVTTSNAAQKHALELARTELTAVNPFETATELEAVRMQLETFYTVTARLSRLSLMEFLR
ncbi:MAG: hypothetical protein KUG69_14810 [Marinosulfonomonas sp.]|nr:hypothetical protein [Marinosulfonomonas sp.]